VPLHFIGEDVAVGVKQGGGAVSHLMNEVDIVCLPKHLPEFIDVDITDLELDEMLTLSDIKLPEGVSIPALAQALKPTVRSFRSTSSRKWLSRKRKSSSQVQCLLLARNQTPLPNRATILATTTPTTINPVSRFSEKTASWRSFCLRLPRHAQTDTHNRRPR